MSLSHSHPPVLTLDKSTGQIPTRNPPIDICVSFAAPHVFAKDNSDSSSWIFHKPKPLHLSNFHNFQPPQTDSLMSIFTSSYIVFSTLSAIQTYWERERERERERKWERDGGGDNWWINGAWLCERWGSVQEERGREVCSFRSQQRWCSFAWRAPQGLWVHEAPGDPLRHRCGDHSGSALPALRLHIREVWLWSQWDCGCGGVQGRDEEDHACYCWWARVLSHSDGSWGWWWKFA